VTECYFRNIDIVRSVRGLGINAWRGNAFWDKLGFLDIRCEQATEMPMEFQMKEDYHSAQWPQGYSNVAKVAVVDCSFAAFGSVNSSLSGYKATSGTPSGSFDQVTFANLKMAGVTRSSLFDGQFLIVDPADPHYDPNAPGMDPRFVKPTNVVFSSITDQIHLRQAVAASSSTNWKTSGNTLALINDGLTTEGQATNTNDAWAVYDFGGDTAINRAVITKDNGTNSVGKWKLERWDQHIETPQWVTVFDFKDCPVDGPNEVKFSTVIGTAVRITFKPRTTGNPPVPTGPVGVNEVEVYGVRVP
jgi:hypothetical protein